MGWWPTKYLPPAKLSELCDAQPIDMNVFTGTKLTTLITTIPRCKLPQRRTKLCFLKIFQPCNRYQLSNNFVPNHTNTFVMLLESL